MATYSATVQLSNGTLTVTRPHPSTDAVDELIDTLIYQVRDGESPVTSIGITIVTDDTAPAPAPDPAQLTVDAAVNGSADTAADTTGKATKTTG